MTPNDVLAMPITLFWSMNNYVERIRADEDMRSFRVGATVQNGGAEEFCQQLNDARGTVYVFDPTAQQYAELDREGLAGLKDDALQQLG